MANAKNQAVESKTVNERISRLEWEKNRICKNAGITRHVHESKQDTRSPWRQFTANLRCSRKLNHLSLQPQNVIERKGESDWTRGREKLGGSAGRPLAATEVQGSAALAQAERHSALHRALVPGVKICDCERAGGFIYCCGSQAKIKILVSTRG